MIFTFILCSLFALSPVRNVYVDNNDNVNKVSYVESKQRKNITYDESNYTITYNSDDFLNNEDNYNYWYNVCNTLVNEGYISSSEYLSVQGSYTTAGNYELTLIYVIDNGSKYVLHFNSQSHPYSVDIDYTNESINFYATSYLSIISETYYNLFPYEPTMAESMAVSLGDFIRIMVSPLVAFATGIATGISTMASDLFLITDVTTGAVIGLSNFGGIIALFCGIALAITLTTRVYLWIVSLGKN